MDIDKAFWNMLCHSHLAKYYICVYIYIYVYIYMCVYTLYIICLTNIAISFFIDRSYLLANLCLVINYHIYDICCFYNYHPEIYLQ